MEGDAHIAGRLALLERWARALQVLQVTHGIAAERFDLWGRVTSICTAMLSAVVGTAIFASFSASPHPGARILAGVSSLLAAALGAGQLIWNYPELASRHRSSAVDYAALRRRIEIRVVRGPVSDADVEAMTVEWEQIEQAAPTLPGSARRRTRRVLDDFTARVAALEARRSSGSGPAG